MDVHEIDSRFEPVEPKKERPKSTAYFQRFIVKLGLPGIVRFEIENTRSATYENIEENDDE